MLARRPAPKSESDVAEKPVVQPSAPLYSEITNYPNSYNGFSPVPPPVQPAFNSALITMSPVSSPVPPPVPPVYTPAPPPVQPIYQPYPPVPPSAPLQPSYLDHLSYDQIAAWWNGLNVNHRRAMIGQGVQLTKAQIVQLRGRYYQYLPKDYYPKITQNPDQLGASDYYLIFYLYEELSQKITESRLYFNWMEVDVYGKKSAFKAAFEAPPPSYDEATAWWARLTSGDRQQFIERNQDPKKIYMIHQAFRPYYRYRKPVNSNLDCYDYYLLYLYGGGCFCRHSLFCQDLILYNSIQVSLGLANLAVQGTAYAAEAVVDGLAFLGRNIRGSENDKKSKASDALSGLGWILALVAAASAAIISSVYVGIKTASSLKNLRQGKKLIRSLVRISAMIGGAYLGATQGLLVGALIGSCFPGIGTAAGAILGAIFGAPITAALSGALAKHLMRFIADRRKGSTNPDKWKLPPLDGPGNTFHGMSTDDIQILFQKLRDEKNSQYKSSRNPFKGSILDSSNHAEKTRYNKFLDAIQKGHDPQYSIRVDQATRFRWSKENRAIERVDAPLPVLAEGLTI